MLHYNVTNSIWSFLFQDWRTKTIWYIQKPSHTGICNKSQWLYLMKQLRTKGLSSWDNVTLAHDPFNPSIISSIKWTILSLAVSFMEMIPILCWMKESQFLNLTMAHATPTRINLDHKSHLSHVVFLDVTNLQSQFCKMHAGYFFIGMKHIRCMGCACRYLPNCVNSVWKAWYLRNCKYYSRWTLDALAIKAKHTHWSIASTLLPNWE